MLGSDPPSTTEPDTPPYDLAAGLRGTPLGEAVQLIDEHHAAVLLEAAKTLERKFGVTPATVELRLMSAKAQQSSGGQVEAKLVDATEATDG